MTNKLTIPESKRLQQFEYTIERAFVSYIEMAVALLGIREDQLFLGKHKSFDEYCQVRWNFGSNYANKLISSMEAANDVKEVLVLVDKTVNKMGTVVPKSEAVAREIAKIETETERADLWVKSVETAPQHEPTAAHVAKTRKEMFPNEKPAEKTSSEIIKVLINRIDAIRLAIDGLPENVASVTGCQTALDRLNDARKALFGVTR